MADRLGAGRHDRRVRRVGVLEARDADLVVVGLASMRHGHRLVDLDAHGDVADLLATRLRAGAAQRPGRDDEHDDDAAEVGDRVADGGRRGVGRAGRGRRERRGVGQRTGVGAGDGARLEAERAPMTTAMPPTRASAPATTSMVGQPRRSEAKKWGARHDTDRVREQHQPEGADHLGDLEVDPAAADQAETPSAANSTAAGPRRTPAIRTCPWPPRASAAPRGGAEGTRRRSRTGWSRTEILPLFAIPQ